MSIDLNDFLRNAFDNNSFNFNSMHLELKKTWENSFSYLDGLQKSYAGYESYPFISNDENARNNKKIGRLYLNNLNKVCFDINYDFIHINNRSEYKSSKFYHKKLNIDDIINNPLIFNKLPIIMIDNKVIWDYQIEICNNRMTVVLPFQRNFIIENARRLNPEKFIYHDYYIISKDGKISCKDSTQENTFYPDPHRLIELEDDVFPFNINYIPVRIENVRRLIETNPDTNISDLIPKIKNILKTYYKIEDYNDESVILVNKVYDDLMYINHDIQIQIIENVYYERINVTKDNVQFNSETKSFTIDENIINKELPITDGTMFCTINIIDDDGIPEKIDSVLIEMNEIDTGIFDVILTDDLFNKINNTNNSFFVSLVYFERLYQHTFYTGKPTIESDGINDNIFILEKSDMEPYEMPIPNTNCIIMKKSVDEDGFKFLNNNCINRYYPNIYRINDDNKQNGDIYKVFYFYYTGYDLHYTVIHDFYFKYLKNKFKLPFEEIIDKIYRNQMDYSDFTDEEINEFKNTFIDILTYYSYIHRYGELDFIHRYKLDEENRDKPSICHQIDRMKEWVEIEPFMLKEYVMEQKKKGSFFFLFTNTINLESRKRSNTSTEFKTKHQFQEDRYVFAIANYHKDESPLNIRVFVDGLFVMDLYQKRKGSMDYIYIPCNLITDDSFIEVELLDDFHMETEIKFNSMDETKDIIIVETNENVLPTLADLVILNNSYEIYRTNTINNAYSNAIKNNTIDSSMTLEQYRRNVLTGFIDIGLIDFKDYGETNDDEYKYRYDNAFFDITTHNVNFRNLAEYKSQYPKFTQNTETGLAEVTGDISKRGYPDNVYEYQRQRDILIPEHGIPLDWDLSKRIKFPQMTNITIKPNSDEVVGIPIRIRLSKLTEGIRYKVKQDGEVYLEFVDNRFGFNKDFLRVFVNGRLLPRSKYMFYPMYYLPRIKFVDEYQAGDIIYIEISPYRYTQVYYKEDISPAEDLLDLRKILNKPFDIRYYDVYLNGRKLSINNAVTIDPWTVKLVNLKSVYNLLIFEKERDWEYFGMDYNTKTKYFSVDELLQKGFITDEDKLTIINNIFNERKDKRLNIYDNTNDEEKQDYDNGKLIYLIVDSYYHDELIPKMFMNPDYKQSSIEVLLEYYYEIFEKYALKPFATINQVNTKKRKEKYPPALCLNPDLQFDGNGSENAQIVYIVGHPTDNDVAEEMLNTNIKLKEKYKIKLGGV